MNGNPTAEQSRFQEWCRGLGCFVSPRPCDSIHHIKGSKMKLKGVKNPGEWYVLPLSFYWHQDGKNRAAVHVNKTAFTQIHGSQKSLWIKLMGYYKQSFGRYPMPDHEYQIYLERA